MPELLLDLLNMESYHTFYFTLMIGLMLKAYWFWNLQYTLLHKIETSEKWTEQTAIIILDTKKSHTNSHLQWICKYIRKKSVGTTTDDSELPFPSF